MSNKSLFLFIALLFLFLSVALAGVALQHDLWREFFVSELLLLVSALAALTLLRKRG